MEPEKRQKILHDFKYGDKTQFLLVSIKVGGVGLNLSEANVVVILEPWWNPAVEDQAVDRINRIGQKKAMRIYKLLSKNTLEEKIKDI